jgi:tetratricopeptide (TPR) repeat protein
VDERSGGRFRPEDVMARRAWMIALVSLFLAALTVPAAFAQQQQQSQPLKPQLNDPSRIQDSSTILTPQQLRRAEPPPANATTAELEMRADSLREEKLFSDALDYYKAAIAKGPRTAQLYNKVGISELQLTRLGDAHKDFDRALKMDKQFPEAYNNLGVVYYIQKKYKNAIKEYGKAVDLREASASFHSNLGTAYFARKEFEKANAEYIRAMQIDPDIFERRSQGGVSAHLSSPEDRAHYDYVMAKLFAKSGNPDRSLQYLRKAMEEGYSKINDVFRDAEFAELRKDKRFGELMSARPAPLPN